MFPTYVESNLVINYETMLGEKSMTDFALAFEERHQRNIQTV